MRWLALIAACAVLSACAPQLSGQVAPMSAEDASEAAGDIAAFVRQRARPSDGPIAVTHALSDTVLWPVLADDLRAAGYTVANGGGAHQLRYAVASLPAGMVLRAALDKASAARLYQPAVDGPMTPSGPMSVQVAVE